MFETESSDIAIGLLHCISSAAKLGLLSLEDLTRLVAVILHKHPRRWHSHRNRGHNNKCIHVNPERSFGGTDGELPSEASQLRKGGSGGPPPEN